MNRQLTKLDQMLKTHDWYYHMSDDHRAYKKGMDSMIAIQQEMIQINSLGFEKEAKELIMEYSLQHKH